MSALDVQVGGGHYKDWPIQPAEFNQKNKISYCEANVIKYVCRHRVKNGVEDLKKAIHYIELLLEMEYGDSQGDTGEPVVVQEGANIVFDWSAGRRDYDLRCDDDEQNTNSNNRG